MEQVLNATISILFDGVAYAMLLFIISVGLSITMGLMGFANLAHGAFAMAYEQRYRQYQAEYAPERNLVSTRATLVIVPSHLLHQWEGEIKKFNPELRVISVTTVTQMPKAAAVRKADIVLCSVNLFSSDKYWSKIVGVHRNAIAVSDTAARNQYEMEQVAPSPPSWSAHDGANSHKRQRYVPSFHPSILP